MLRPLDWSEVFTLPTGLEDVVVGLFNTDGEQIQTTVGLELSAGLYHADFSLGSEYAGQAFVVRIKSDTWGDWTSYDIFVTGERLPVSAVTGLVEE